MIKENLTAWSNTLELLEIIDYTEDYGYENVVFITSHRRISPNRITNTLTADLFNLLFHNNKPAHLLSEVERRLLEEFLYIISHIHPKNVLIFIPAFLSPTSHDEIAINIKTREFVELQTYLTRPAQCIYHSIQHNELDKEEWIIDALWFTCRELAIPIDDRFISLLPKPI